MKKILGVLVAALVLSFVCNGYASEPIRCVFSQPTSGGGTAGGWSSPSGNGGRCVFSSPSGGSDGVEVTKGGNFSGGGNVSYSGGMWSSGNNVESTYSAAFISDKNYRSGNGGMAINTKPWYETSTDPKVVDLRTKMNEAVTAVENEFKDKIGDVEDILTDTKKAQKELEDAAWKKCVEDIKAAVKESNWAEISKILTEWKTEKAKIVDQFKDGIKALEDQITDLKKDQETAVKTVKDEFIKQMEAFKPTNGLSFAVGHQPSAAGYSGLVDVSKTPSAGYSGVVDVSKKPSAGSSGVIDASKTPSAGYSGLVDVSKNP